MVYEQFQQAQNERSLLEEEDDLSSSLKLVDEITPHYFLIFTLFNVVRYIARFDFLDLCRSVVRLVLG